jgi:hypothetical protein
MVGRINKYTLRTRDSTIVHLLIKSILIIDCIYGPPYILRKNCYNYNFISHWTIFNILNISYYFKGFFFNKMTR